MQHIMRLFVEHQLSHGEQIALGQNQSHYVSKVMRGRVGTNIRLFNGQDGEWQSQITQITRRQVSLRVQQSLRHQIIGPDIELAFAPIKRTRMEFIVEKATEMGVRAMQIVCTDHTVQKSVRLDRLRAIVVEAAEQTERLDLPLIRDEMALGAWMAQFNPDRALVFCDESAEVKQAILPALQAINQQKCTVLIGPEGGFSPAERQLIGDCSSALAVSLGPRILRADTAAIASLTLLQSVCGDW